MKWLQIANITPLWQSIAQKTQRPWYTARFDTCTLGHWSLEPLLHHVTKTWQAAKNNWRVEIQTGTTLFSWLVVKRSDFPTGSAALYWHHLRVAVLKIPKAAASLSAVFMWDPCCLMIIQILGPIANNARRSQCENARALHRRLSCNEPCFNDVLPKFPLRGYIGH